MSYFEILIFLKLYKYNNSRAQIFAEEKENNIQICEDLKRLIKDLDFKDPHPSLRFYSRNEKSFLISQLMHYALYLKVFQNQKSLKNNLQAKKYL